MRTRTKLATAIIRLPKYRVLGRRRLEQLLHPLMVVMLTAPCTFLPGCIAFPSYQPVDVLVLDAETGNPLSNATVSVRYPRGGLPVLNTPKDISASTDRCGRATLRVAEYFGGVAWEIIAQNYIALRFGPMSRRRIPEELEIATEEHTDHQEVIIRIYRQPKPTITVFVPEGYRGPLKLDLPPTSSFVQGAIGRREFTFEASQTGYVRIDAAPLLLRSLPKDVIVRFADGTQIPFLAMCRDDERVTLRRMGDFGNRWLFMIGTRADEDMMRRVLFERIDDPHLGLRLIPEALDALFAP